MFTGIITHIGTILSCDKSGDLTLRIACGFDAADLTIGESIACNGCCLTVVSKGTDAGQHWFDVQLSDETLRCTRPASWDNGARVNLERALQVGDRLGGHFVTGHVDGLATITDITPIGDSHQLTLEAPEELRRFIAAKGSVTLDGVSLTVNAAQTTHFTVNIIAHSWSHTNLSERKAGDTLHLEVDLLARYIHSQ